MSADFQQLYNQFNPEVPLPAGDPRYVDCDQARGVPTLLADVESPLNEDGQTTLLFCGHIGDGKTTTSANAGSRRRN
jgi:hypothetical protein